MTDDSRAIEPNDQIASTAPEALSESQLEEVAGGGLMGVVAIASNEEAEATLREALEGLGNDGESPAILTRGVL